ncbi:hypothetical protein HKD37_20G056837 [Glycine soja]
MVELENEGAGPQCRQGKQSMVAASKKNQQEDEGAGTRKQMKKTNAQGRRRKGSNDEWNVNSNTIQVQCHVLVPRHHVGLTTRNWSSFLRIAHRMEENDKHDAECRGSTKDFFLDCSRQGPVRYKLSGGRTYLTAYDIWLTKTKIIIILSTTNIWTNQPFVCPDHSQDDSLYHQVSSSITFKVYLTEQKTKARLICTWRTLQNVGLCSIIGGRHLKLESDLDIQAANPSYTRAPSTVPENLGGPKFKIGTYYCKGAISPTADGRSGGKVELSSARSA